MKKERMQELAEMGFNENWLKEISENFEPKENGKYEIHIYNCEDMDQEPDTGVFIASYFFDNEYDLTAIHYFFEGLFYVMRVVETQKELGRGIIDGAPFEEMEEYEGKSWEWLDYSSLGPKLHKKREKEKEDLVNRQNFIKEKEGFLKNLIDEKIEEIFLEYRKEIDAESGDISPMDALRLDEFKNNLLYFVQRVCC